MTAIRTPLDVRALDNYKYDMILNPFIVELDTLKKHGLKNKDGEYKAIVPIGFIYDEESIPVVRGTNRRGGTIHDFLCRVDSDPIVTKAIAAECYLEIMSYTYEIVDRGYWQHFKDFTKRWTKWAVVYVAPGYFHKHKVMATGKEIGAGFDTDPYITVEQLKADVKVQEAKIVTAQAQKVEVAAVLDSLPAATKEDVKIADAKTVVLDTKIDIATQTKDEKVAKIAEKESAK